MKDIPPATLKEVPPEALEGRWYVIHSSYRYWHKKDRHDVVFNYALRPDCEDINMFDDRVDYKQGDRERVFEGVDLQDPELPGHFMWRGEGILYGVVNHWYLVGLDVDAGWMVVYFPPSSMGTAPGLEIVTRDEKPAEETIRAALEYIENDPDLKARSEGIKPVPR
jgi:hypothetical protein